MSEIRISANIKDIAAILKKLEDDIPPFFLDFLESIIDSCSDKDVAFILDHNYLDISLVEEILKILKEKNRLNNAAKLICKTKSILLNLHHLIDNYFEYFKDYLIVMIQELIITYYEKAQKIIPKMMRNLLFAKKKIDNLNSIPSIEDYINNAYEYAIYEFEHFYIIFLTQKYYNSINKQEFEHDLKDFEEIIKEIKLNDIKKLGPMPIYFLKESIKLYIEFKEIKDYKLLKKMMRILELCQK